MTDTTIQPANIQTDPTEERFSRLESMLEKLTVGLNAFSSSVVTVLSGQQTAAPATQTQARRRGRPPKAASEATPTKAEPRPLHPKSVEMADLVKRTGRITQTELANQLGVERSAVQAYSYPLLERGMIVARLTKPVNGHRQVVYYRPEWVSFRGE